MNHQWECEVRKMRYILTFMAGAAFGLVITCCFAISGQESRREEEYLDGKQDTDNGGRTA